MLKTLAQYLSAASGDHEAAAKAMHADLVSLSNDNDNLSAERDREAAANIRARAIVKAAEPLLTALDVPIPPAGQRPSQDAMSALEEGVGTAVQTVQGLEAGVELWQNFAAEVGLDVDAFLEADSPEKAEEILNGFYKQLDGVLDGLDATSQELNVYKFAQANGLNPEAVLLQKGLEGLELRDVEVTGKDGKKTTEKRWEIPGQQEGEYVPALEHLRPVLGALKPTQQQSGTAWIGGQEKRGDSQDAKSVYDQYRSQKQEGKTAVTVADPLNPQPQASAASQN